ncbi:MAG: hypothetical protein PG977_001121 [Bartonella clarridgeiae]|nr:MAG: hypothetical protein PG977_001121 [Bartonella clarridgeiae]
MFMRVISYYINSVARFFSFLLIGYWYHNNSVRDGARIALLFWWFCPACQSFIALGALLYVLGHRYFLPYDEGAPFFHRL